MCFCRRVWLVTMHVQWAHPSAREELQVCFVSPCLSDCTLIPTRGSCASRRRISASSSWLEEPQVVGQTHQLAAAGAKRTRTLRSAHTCICAQTCFLQAALKASSELANRKAELEGDLQVRMVAEISTAYWALCGCGLCVLLCDHACTQVFIPMLHCLQDELR